MGSGGALAKAEIASEWLIACLIWNRTETNIPQIFFGLSMIQLGVMNNVVQKLLRRSEAAKMVVQSR